MGGLGAETLGTETFLVSVPVSISQDPKSKSPSQSWSHETQIKSLGLGLIFETRNIICLTHHKNKDYVPKTDWVQLMAIWLLHFLISYHIWGLPIKLVYKFCLQTKYNLTLYYDFGYTPLGLCNYSFAFLLLYSCSFSNIYLLVLPNIQGLCLLFHET